jgi:hypothetical protein
METFISYQKEKTNPFPTWLGRHQSLGARQMGVSKQMEEASSDSFFKTKPYWLLAILGK